jgi:hypothetical protein
MLAAAALLLGLAVLSRPFRHDAAWRVPLQHQPFVEAALAGAVDTFSVSKEEYRRDTRPHVEVRGRETCVTLASRWRHGGGSYMACFDSHDGSKTSESAIGMPFGGTRLTDRVARWIW